MGPRAGEISNRQARLRRRPPRDLLILAALVAITLATFWPAAGCWFLNGDDQTYLYLARRPFDWSAVSWIFTNRALRLYHPLTPLTFAILHHFFLDDPASYHAFNLAVHAANVGLVFLLINLLTRSRWRSVAVAACFAVHPLRLESVVWIAELKDLMFALFGLATIYCYVLYARSGRSGLYGAALPLYVASLLYKPMLVTLPALLLLLDVYPLKRTPFNKRLWPSADESIADDLPREDGAPPSTRFRSIRFLLLEKLPFALAAAAVVCAMMLVPDRDPPVAFVHFSASTRAGNAIVACFLYVYDTFDIADIGTMHPLTTRPIAQVALAGAFLAATTAWALLASRRRPMILVGWIWFLLTLLPVIGILQIYWQATADHYSYFPSIGLLMAIVWALPAPPQGAKTIRQALGAGAAGVVILLSCYSFQRIAVWHDGVRYWTDAVHKNPTVWAAHFYLAGALDDYGHTQEAAGEYREAIRLDEAEAKTQQVYLTLGLLENDLHQPNAAIESLSKAIRDWPGSQRAHAALADALAAKGDLAGAAAERRIAAHLSAK